MQSPLVAASPRSIVEYELLVRREGSAKPERAREIVGMRELEQRHLAEFLHRLLRQTGNQKGETEYLQNWELASRNCPSAARIACGMGFCRNITW